MLLSSGSGPAAVLQPCAKAADLADYVKAASLAKVGGTGSYADLLNKPTLATVAASGSYADPTNNPVMAKLGDACGTNLVMKGLKADGSYECVTAGIARVLSHELRFLGRALQPDHQRRKQLDPYR